MLIRNPDYILQAFEAGIREMVKKDKYLVARDIVTTTTR
jgi:hypothetical protein